MFFFLLLNNSWKSHFAYERWQLFLHWILNTSQATNIDTQVKTLDNNQLRCRHKSKSKIQVLFTKTWATFELLTISNRTWIPKKRVLMETLNALALEKWDYKKNFRKSCPDSSFSSHTIFEVFVLPKWCYTLIFYFLASIELHVNILQGVLVLSLGSQLY